MFGLFDRFTPKFAKRYVNLSEMMLKAFEAYREEVLKGEFSNGPAQFPHRRERTEQGEIRNIQIRSTNLPAVDRCLVLGAS